MPFLNHDVAIIRVMGGLGNQLFQYAFGRAISKFHNVRVIFDASLYEDVNQHTGFELEGLLPVDDIIFSRDEKKKLLRNLKIKKTLNRMTGAGPFVKRIVERHVDYQPALFSTKALYYEGYWQSWKYSHDIQPSLINAVRSYIESRADLKSVPVDISGGDSIAVHIRLGDYLSNATAAALHSIPLADYYARAIDEIVAREKMSSPKVYVFSDDLDPLRHVALRSRGEIILCNSDISDPYTDMYSMSKAKHLVIANSSFSWWAANLSEGKGLIACPSRWYVDREIVKSDMFPEHWQVFET